MSQNLREFRYVTTGLIVGGIVWPAVTILTQILVSSEEDNHLWREILGPGFFGAVLDLFQVTTGLWLGYLIGASLALRNSGSPAYIRQLKASFWTALAITVIIGWLDAAVGHSIAILDRNMPAFVWRHFALCVFLYVILAQAPVLLWLCVSSTALNRHKPGPVQ